MKLPAVTLSAAKSWTGRIPKMKIVWTKTSHHGRGALRLLVTQLGRGFAPLLWRFWLRLSTAERRCKGRCANSSVTSATHRLTAQLSFGHRVSAPPISRLWLKKADKYRGKSRAPEVWLLLGTASSPYMHRRSEQRRLHGLLLKQIVDQTRLSKSSLVPKTC